jgi:hypothetical protein
MRLADINAVALQAVMIEQPLVLFRKGLVLRKVVHGRRKAVATNPLGNAAGNVQSILKTCRQRFERLRVTKVDVFPVGIREDRVKQHVLERSSRDGDPETIQYDEVKSNDVARVMDLGEGDFPLDVLLQFPLLDSPF